MNRTVPILAITVLSLTSSALAWGEDGGGVVKGGATTTVAGGTGAPDFTPVITKLTFHWRDRRGRFEGPAPAPTSAKGGNPGGERESVVEGERGELGGRRIHKKKKSERDS